MKITHTHCITTILIDSLIDLVYNQASQIWGNKMPLCRQHFATNPFTIPPVSVAVRFLPPSMYPNCHYSLSKHLHNSPVYIAVIFLPPTMYPTHNYSVSPNPSHLAVFVMSHECCEKLPQCLGKLKVNFFFLVLHVYV
jgi:hypothetical protein